MHFSWENKASARSSSRDYPLPHPAPKACLSPPVHDSQGPSSDGSQSSSSQLPPIATNGFKVTNRGRLEWRRLCSLSEMVSLTLKKSLKTLGFSFYIWRIRKVTLPFCHILFQVPQGSISWCKIQGIFIEFFMSGQSCKHQCRLLSYRYSCIIWEEGTSV